MSLFIPSQKELILNYNGKFTKFNKMDLKKILYSNLKCFDSNSDFNKLLLVFDDIISIQIYNDLVFRLNLTNNECIFLYDTENIYKFIFENIILNKPLNTNNKPLNNTKSDNLYFIKDSTIINLSCREEFFKLFLNIIIRNSYIYQSEIEYLNYIIRNFELVCRIELYSSKIKSESFYSNNFEYTVKFILKNSDHSQIVIKNDKLYSSLNGIFQNFKKRNSI